MYNIYNPFINPLPSFPSNILWIDNISNPNEKKLMKSLIDGIRVRDLEEFKKNILSFSTKINVDFAFIMKELINNKIRDEELYNLLYVKKGFIIPYEFTYKDRVSFIEDNNSLIRTIARRGLVTTNKQGQIIHIFNPVNFFIKKERLILAKKILDVGISTNQPDNQGMTPIFISIKINNIDFFRELLYSYHPDLNKKNKDGETPFMYLLHNNDLNKKDREGYFNILMKYKESRFAVNFNFKGNKITNDLMKQVIKERNYDLLKKIIIKHPLISNQMVIDGKSIMSHLIDHVIDDEETFNILYKQRAAIDQSYVRVNEKSEWLKDLCYLIERNVGLIKSIIRNGFYVQKSNGEVEHISTPLIFFIDRTKTNLVNALLENGAPVEERDEHEHSPLFHTILCNNFNLFKKILYNYHPKLVYEVFHSKEYKRLKVCYPINELELKTKPKAGDRYIREIKLYIDSLKNTSAEISNLPLLPGNKSMVNVFHFTNQDLKSPSEEDGYNKSDEYPLYPNNLVKLNTSSIPVQNNEPDKEKIKVLRKVKSEYISISSHINSENKSDEEKLRAAMSDDEDDKEKIVKSYEMNETNPISLDEKKENKETKSSFSDEKKENKETKSSFSDEEKENKETKSSFSDEEKENKETRKDDTITELEKDKNQNTDSDTNINRKENKAEVNETIMENKINPTDKIKESDQPENAGHTKLKEKRKVIVEGYPELHYYCIHNKPICIKAYLKNFIEDLNEVGGPENTTPLLLSIKYEKLECVRTLLSYHPDLTIPDNHGDTPLSYLLKNYQRQQSSQLLDLLLPNLSIHQTYGPDHLTPLYYCLKYQNRQGLNYLSKHKDFNINELDKDQNTPLLYLIKLYLEKVVSTKKQALPAPTTPIVKTSEYFKLFEFIGLILLLGANVNYEHPQECKVPLIYAIEKDQIELVELLMFHHANPYYQLPNYLTPLKLTIKQNNVPIAKILLDARYRPQIKKAKNKK